MLQVADYLLNGTPMEGPSAHQVHISSARLTELLQMQHRYGTYADAVGELDNWQH